MKTTTIIVAAILSLTACKKDRECICEGKMINYVSKQDTKIKTDITYKKVKKNTDLCKSYYDVEYFNGSIISRTDMTCKIK